MRYEKYKYQLKNQEIENALNVIFGKEDVERELQRQMSNDSYFFYLAIDSEENGVKGAIKVSKEEIERVRTYDPTNWNPYPEVEPIDEGKYLVYVCSDGQKFIDVDEYTIKNGEGDWRVNFNDDVLAFRPLNVEPPELEDLN